MLAHLKIDTKTKFVIILFPRSVRQIAMISPPQWMIFITILDFNPSFSKRIVTLTHPENALSLTAALPRLMMFFVYPDRPFDCKVQSFIQTLQSIPAVEGR